MLKKLNYLLLKKELHDEKKSYHDHSCKPRVLTNALKRAKQVFCVFVTRIFPITSHFYIANKPFFKDEWNKKNISQKRKGEISHRYLNTKTSLWTFYRSTSVIFVNRDRVLQRKTKEIFVSFGRFLLQTRFHEWLVFVTRIN